MLYRYDKGRIVPVQYCDYSELQGCEKDLENLLASCLEDLYAEGGQSFMTIFQERAMQEEPDICALDAQGGLVIFELKRGNAGRGAVEQIMRYAERFGRRDYAQLNSMYRAYINDSSAELKKAHADAFELSADFHMNPSDRKGIMFDTNLSWSSDNEKCMLERGHIEAYGDVKWAVDSFAKGDYVLFYSKGRGVIAIGEITSRKAKELKDAQDADDGRYHEVKMIVPQNVSGSDGYNQSLYPYEIKNLLDQGFYFARTDKRPYLSEEQVKILIEALQKKYNA